MHILRIFNELFLNFFVCLHVMPSRAVEVGARVVCPTGLCGESGRDPTIVVIIQMRYLCQGKLRQFQFNKNKNNNYYNDLFFRRPFRARAM